VICSGIMADVTGEDSSNNRTSADNNADRQNNPVAPNSPNEEVEVCSKTWNFCTLYDAYQHPWQLLLE